MLDTHQKFLFKDKANKNDFFMEVNWEGNDQCKTIKVTFPGQNRTESFIERKHLLEFLFAIGTSSDQRQMIPQTIRKMKWYETVLEIKATKDVHKNEKLVFPIKLSLPDQTEEIIGNLKGQKLSTKLY